MGEKCFYVIKEMHSSVMNYNTSLVYILNKRLLHCTDQTNIYYFVGIAQSISLFETMQLFNVMTSKWFYKIIQKNCI